MDRAYGSAVERLWSGSRGPIEAERTCSRVALGFCGYDFRLLFTCPDYVGSGLGQNQLTSERTAICSALLGFRIAWLGRGMRMIMPILLRLVPRVMVLRIERSFVADMALGMRNRPERRKGHSKSDQAIQKKPSHYEPSRVRIVNKATHPTSKSKVPAMSPPYQSEFISLAKRGLCVTRRSICVIN